MTNNDSYDPMVGVAVANGCVVLMAAIAYFCIAIAVGAALAWLLGFGWKKHGR